MLTSFIYKRGKLNSADYLFLNMSEKIVELSQVVDEITHEHYEKALTILQEINQKYPNNPDILYYLGVVNNELGKYDEAIGFFKAHTDLNPNSAGGYAGLGFAYFQKEDWNSALQFYERAKDLSPTVDTLFYLAEIFFELHQYEKSISYYNVILTEKYGNIMAADEQILLGLAKNFLGLEKPKQALGMLEICEKYHIKTPLFYRLKGIALVLLEKFKEAIPIFESYLKQEPDAEDIKELLEKARKSLSQ